MADLLKSLPKVTYNGYTLSNLLTKIAVIKSNFDKYDVYYNYTIHDGERPDTIAYDYYGDSSYAWLVLYCNTIIDPYYQWPLGYNMFHDYLRSKYGTVFELKSQIHHYIYTGVAGNTADDIARINWTMSIDTYDSLDVITKSGWTPVYTYDYENDLNEAKRHIRLISNQYIKQVDRELVSLLNDN